MEKSCLDQQVIFGNIMRDREKRLNVICVEKTQTFSGRVLNSSLSDDDEGPLASTCSSLDVLHEVNKYLCEPKCDKGTNPLSWWKLNEHKFPNVAKVVNQINCIPTTSTAPERVFSPAGNIATVKRSLLKPEMVNALLKVNDFEMVDLILLQLMDL